MTIKNGIDNVKIAFTINGLEFAEGGLDVLQELYLEMANTNEISFSEFVKAEVYYAEVACGTGISLKELLKLRKSSLLLSDLYLLSHPVDPSHCALF